jgi:serine/threonine protein kinase
MEKNFNEISCVFCGVKNTTENEICTNCSNIIDIQKSFIGQKLSSYKLTKYIARGFYGLTYKAEDIYSGKEFAIKLISKKAYEYYDKDFASEAELHGKLNDIISIVRYIGAGEHKININLIELEFYYIISEWVNGLSLKNYLETSIITIDDILTASKDLFLGLQIIETNNLWHNDLHAENILIEEIGDLQQKLYNRSTNKVFKIIDIGSMTFKSPDSVKLFNDVAKVGQHIIEMTKNCLNNTELSKGDKVFLFYLEDICSQLIDEGPTRRINSANEALSLIEVAFMSSRTHKDEEIQELDSPFRYINANDIPSAWLLKNMFSNKLTYFQDIISIGSQSQLITGPRGCGKTMLLKNMRFITLYDSQEQNNVSFFDDLHYIGLFISARKEFGNYLVSYRKMLWSKNEQLIFLYFNLLVTLELLSIIYRITRDKYFTKESFSNLNEFLKSRFNIKYSSILTIQEKLRKISTLIIADQINGNFVTIENSSPKYLIDLFSEFKKATNPLLSTKEIFILVDDMSLPRIPEYIQKALNPCIFNTGANYKTRITAHSDGLVLTDLGNDIYKHNRDLQEINLGYEYWKLSNDYQFCIKSFDDILEIRFKLANNDNFHGLEQYLGTNKIQSPAKNIGDLYDQKKLRTFKYFGAEMFIQLCSGDISYLIDLLGRMDRLNEHKYPISLQTQNSTIRNYARNELRSLQDIKSENGINLYEIAFYFGIWSKTMAFNKKDDYLRLEVSLVEEDKFVKSVLRELLCYGIFIDAGYSNDSQGNTAKKLLFRRIFTPAFPTTFIDHSTFAITKKHFCDFIKNPKDFVRKKMSSYGVNPDEQLAIEQLEVESN